MAPQGQNLDNALRWPLFRVRFEIAACDGLPGSFKVGSAGA
ncbi:hypothetical protein [Flavisphingopyxis soli]|nr:hypothetical protein [Sphingorhabdus soli]